MIVVDASVAVKWYLREEGTAEALEIARGGQVLIAPDLLLLEVANAMWRKARIGQISDRQLLSLASHLPRALDRLVPSSDLLEPALDLARRHDHPVYDCCYLALAVRENATVLTADGRFLHRFQDTPFAGWLSPLIPDRPAVPSR